MGSISTLKKQLEVENTVNYTYSDPVQKIFDKFGVQVGKGLGQGVQMSFEKEQSKLQ